jgi:hypothetical protein
MKRFSISFVLATVLIAGLCISVWSQVTKTITGQFQPFVIDIAQSVPVQVSVPLSGSNPVTMTLPLTVSVNLRVRIDTASRTAKVETLTPPTPVVTVSTITASPFADAPVFEGVLWSIEDAQSLKPQMTIGENQLKFDTQGQFALLNITLKNIGNVPVSIDYGSGQKLEIAIIDSQNRVFAPYATGYQIRELCEYAELNPGLSVSCFIPFELPKDANNLKLRLIGMDETTGKKVSELAVELK